MGYHVKDELIITVIMITAGLLRIEDGIKS